MKLKIAAVAMLVAIGAGAAGYVAFGSGLTRPSSSSQYLTTQVTRQDVVDRVVATGSLAARASYGLAFGSVPVLSDAPAGSGTTASSSSNSSASSSNGSTSVSWTVDRVDVAVGDEVKKGQTLATSTSDLETQIANASRAALSANLQVATAESALSNATTDIALWQAKTSLYAAQTQQATAQAQLRALKAMRAWTTLVAPADGVITAVNLEPGATSPATDAIVVNGSELQVVGNVVESDVTLVALGQPATVTVTALGIDVPGTVTAIAPSAAASTGNSVVTFAVTVALQNPPAAARAGMSAQVSITVAQASSVLAVPVAALGGTAGSYSVRVLQADGRVQVQPVTVGLITSSLAEIQSGLSAGETVITGTTSQRTTTGGGGVFGGGFRVPGANP